MIASDRVEMDVWQMPARAWFAFVAALALVAASGFEALKYMAAVWSSSDEYSYGYFIPAITLFLIWQKSNRLERIQFTGSWAGVLLIALGCLLFVAGNLSTLYVVVQYAVLIIVVGTTLSFTGWRAMRSIFVPLLFLAFMIPLPAFVYNSLSGQLQLLSSQIGVAIIRAFGISVFLEGNVIDLGVLKLQVAEACSGLRFLFPLMALGFIAAYFYKGAFWKRAVIFLSTVPITILMNGARIGVIGILVEHGGRAMAEGFLHDFEGWFVFMICTAVLIGEMWLLARIGKERRPLREVFGLEIPAPAGDGRIRYRTIPKPFFGAAALLVVMLGASALLPQRVEAAPQRKEFYEFPLTIGPWEGRPTRLDSIYLNVLKLDDYVLADYVERGRLINLYVAYYASQRKGQSAHSPSSCIPGDGWEITSIVQRKVEGATVGGHPLEVNRVTIQKGDNKQLVYYWFLQRGRVLTNEYLVKWFLFWDALTRNRTDGAMLRLITPISGSETVEQADDRIAAFARTLAPQLGGFIPE